MRELNIDWAALHSAFQMNMPEVRCFLDLEDGRVLKLPPGDPALATVRGNPQRYVGIDAIPSRIQYQWLDDFIKAITDPDVRDRMEAAINGKGAFRRFKDILLTYPEERRRWFEHRDLMMRQRILDWVREQNIAPTNEAPWPDIQGQPDDIAPPAAYKTLEINHLHTPSPIPMSPYRQPPVNNSPHEIEALRDCLIELFDGLFENRAIQNTPPSPIEVEKIATEIGRRFSVKSVHF